MTTMELKSILMHRIAEINDKSFLAAIKTIIESKSEAIIYNTTPDQQDAIGEGREQIAKGVYFTDEQVEEETNKWLKEK
jgi:hypothetical protein